MLKKLLDSINPYKGEARNEFGDYLNSITPSSKEIENKKKEEEKKRDIEKLEREKVRFAEVVEIIKQDTIKCAQRGKRNLAGVITRDGFHRFDDEQTLQSIKYNCEDDYRTEYYKYEDAIELKKILTEKLDALGIKNKVYVETGQAWFYVPKCKRNGTPYEVKELTDKHAGYHVICFKLKW